MFNFVCKTIILQKNLPVNAFLKQSLTILQVITLENNNNSDYNELEH